MRLTNGALPSLEPLIHFEVNGEGERGDPLPRDTEGLYRVLVAGGSAAECGLLDQQSAWPAVLQSLLRGRSNLRVLGARQVHVGNIGRSLTSVAKVCEILERTLPRYENLNLLVLMVGVSDVLDWMESGTPAEWPPNNESTFEFSEHPLETFSWRKGRLALRRAGGTLLRRCGGVVKTHRDFGEKIVELRRRRRESLRLLNRVADPAPMLNHLDLNLRRAIEIGRRKGARVVLARQPFFDRPLTQAEDAVMWNFCHGPLFGSSHSGGEGSEYYTHAAVRELLAKMDDRLVSVARQTGVETVDVRAVVEPNLNNFYDFLHFTPIGAKLVAEAVAATVLHTSATTDLRHLAAAAGAAQHTADSRTGIMVESA